MPLSKIQQVKNDLAWELNKVSLKEDTHAKVKMIELFGMLVEAVEENKKENVLLKKVIELMNENVSAQWERQSEQEVVLKARMTDCEDRVRDSKKRVKELRAQIIAGRK